MAAGDITKALVNDVKYRIGEDTEPGHFSQTQCIMWLDEAQRKLCTEGPILNTVGYANSKQNTEFYTLPDDYYEMIRIEYRPSAGDDGAGDPSVLVRQEVSRGELRHPPGIRHLGSCGFLREEPVCCLVRQGVLDRWDERSLDLLPTASAGAFDDQRSGSEESLARLHEGLRGDDGPAQTRDLRSQPS